MLRSQQQFTCAKTSRKSRVTSIARSTLKTGAWSNLNIFNLQRHAQGRAQLTAMRRPDIGRSLQAMVDMNSGKRRQCLALREAGQQVQQHRGVQPAGQGNTPARGTTPGLQG